MPDVSSYIDRIVAHPQFSQLKNVIENNPWHDHENVFSHAMKTKDIAASEVSASFMQHPAAKRAFLAFMQETMHGLLRKDCMVLIALLHDVGKVLHYREGEEVKPLVFTKADGTTTAPGHEYWGSITGEQIAIDVGLPQEVIPYIARVIKLHDTFNDDYLRAKASWPKELFINDIKGRAEGVYIEALFTIYCDNYTASVSQDAQKIREQLFNDPSLYTPRAYFTR